MDAAEVQDLVELLRSAGASADPEHLVVSYDGDSDSLLVHLFGRGIPAVSVPITDEFMVRFDRSGERVVGLQLDHFLARVALDHPELLVLLDLAELRDTTPEAIADVRRSIARQRIGTLVSRAYSDNPPVTSAAD